MSWLYGESTSIRERLLNRNALVNTLERILIPNFAVAHAAATEPLYERIDQLEADAGMSGSRLAFYDERIDADREELLTELSDVYDLVKAILLTQMNKINRDDSGVGIEHQSTIEFIFDGRMTDSIKAASLAIDLIEAEDGTTSHRIRVTE